FERRCIVTCSALVPYSLESAARGLPSFDTCYTLALFERTQSMKWYPYGHDFGNAEMGGVTMLLNGPMLARSVPTAFVKADVTALPAETYIKNTELRHTIKNALDGVHTFTLDGGKTWRTVSIEVANVVMEGAGALIAYGDKNASKTAESAVIDVGGRTTDLYVA